MNRKSRVLAVILLAVLMLSACGRSEFGTSEITEKKMVITAENARKDDFFMSGSLAVEEGEMITTSAELSKGQIRVEILIEPEEQSIEEVPEMDGEPTIRADLKNGESVSGTVPAGSYMVKATCLEKAKGTVVIEVVPAE